MRTINRSGWLAAGLVAFALMSVSGANAAPKNGNSASCGEYKYHQNGTCKDARSKAGKSWYDEMMAKKWAG